MSAAPRLRVSWRPGVVALLSIMVLTACGAPVHRQVAPTVRPTPGSPVRLLFVGGSVTFGLFASVEANTYPSLIASALRRSGLQVSTDTLATSGATVRSVIRWQLGIPSDIIVVQFGANDYTTGVPLAEFSSSYRTVLKRLHSMSPRALMVCLSGWQSRVPANRSGATGAEYDGVIRRLCQEADGKYLDISRLFADPTNHGPVGRSTFMGVSDWYHPNDRGHNALARAVLALVAPTIGVRAVRVNDLIPEQPSPTPFRNS